MNYATLKTAVDTALATITPPLEEGVMCDADGNRDRFVNRSYTLNFAADQLPSPHTSDDNVCIESWVIEVLFCGNADEWFDRVAEARACAAAIRNAIGAMSLATLLSICDSATPNETVSIRCGSASHDSRLARDGVLVLRLGLTVTSFV